MKFNVAIKNFIQTACARNTLNGILTDGEGCRDFGSSSRVASADSFGTVSTSPTPRPVWEIQRENGRRIDQFEIFLDRKRIGEERGAAELRGLLIGAGVGCAEADRVVAALKMRPVVYVEVHPDESSACRRRSPGNRH